MDRNIKNFVIKIKRLRPVKWDTKGTKERFALAETKKLKFRIFGVILFSKKAQVSEKYKNI